MVSRLVGLIGVVVWALAACGGKSDHQMPNAGDGGSGGSGDASSSGDDGEESSTGGTGAGGARSYPGPVAAIDEVEQTDPAVPPGSSAFYWGPGYLGNWFVRAPEPNPISGDAQAAEVVPPRGESKRAYRVQGSGHEYGVDLWAQLMHPGGSAVDLSEYIGIGFWARLEGATDRLVVAADPGVGYFEAPDDVPSVALAVSTEWEQFIVPFDVFGTDGSRVASFDFIAGEGGGDFELWIDDLTLLCNAQCPSYE